MFKMTLNWKQFNIDLGQVESKLKDDFPTYVGNSASDVFCVYFSEILTQEQQDNILNYWESLTADGYKSKEQLAEETNALKESAKAKLLNIGLTVDEIKALL